MNDTAHGASIMYRSELLREILFLLNSAFCIINYQITEHISPYAYIKDKSLFISVGREVPYAPPPGQPFLDGFWTVFSCRFRILMFPEKIPWPKCPKWPVLAQIGPKMDQSWFYTFHPKSCYILVKNHEKNIFWPFLVILAQLRAKRRRFWN